MNSSHGKLGRLCSWPLLALLALAGTFSPSSAWACGTDTACDVPLGAYYVSTPPSWDPEQPQKAVIFFHGHQGNGARITGNQSLIERFHARGYVVIAPNGQMLAMRNGRKARAWPGRRTSGNLRDDLAFMQQVLTDAAERFSIDWRQSLVTGFSSGGSFAWFLACHMAGEFGGFAPIAGALRSPRLNAGCNSAPVHLLHIHGFTDNVVPLEGRPIGNWHQGDAFESITLARTWNGCRSIPDEIELGDSFRCRTWNSCASGKELQLCLHDGGHSMPNGWSSLVLDWFERQKP